MDVVRNKIKASALSCTTESSNISAAAALLSQIKRGENPTLAKGIAALCHK